MADFFDIAKQAPGVPVNAATQTMGGMQQGAQLAQAYQDHQAKMEEHANNMQQFKEHQNEFAFQQMNRVANIQNPAARQMAFNNAQKQLEVAGVPVDPALGALMKDDDYRRSYQQQAMKINGLSYDERSSALFDHAAMLNDPAAAEKSLVAGGQTSAARYATNVNAQISGVANQREMVLKGGETASKDFATVSEQNKPQNEALYNANMIQNLLSNPKGKPLSVADAKGLLDKVVNPGAALRPQTMALLSDADRGVFEHGKALMNQLTGNGNITPSQRQEILDVVKTAAIPYALDLKQSQLEYAQSHPYMNQQQVNFVHSKTPRYDMPQEYAAVERHMNNQMPPSTQAPPAAPDPVMSFHAAAPEVQADIAKYGAQIGIDVSNPKAPNYAANLQKIAGVLANHVKSAPAAAPALAATPGAPAVAAQAPAATQTPTVAPAAPSNAGFSWQGRPGAGQRKFEAAQAANEARIAAGKKHETSGGFGQ